jgi:hypothetical protein
MLFPPQHTILTLGDQPLTVGFGGGIFTNDGSVTITNTTISGNSTSNNA